MIKITSVENFRNNLASNNLKEALRCRMKNFRRLCCAPPSSVPDCQ